MSGSRQSLLQRFFLRLWYPEPSIWQPVFSFFTLLLLPLSGLFRVLSAQRRSRFQAESKPLLQNNAQKQPVSVPVVIVGNITVGGAGKTPVVMALANALRAKGIEVGIISRGYGAQSTEQSQLITANTVVDKAGDEPLLLAQITGCPVVTAPNRVAAAETLLGRFPQTQLIISDDGLQHYRLPRALEIAVLDGQRGVGNGHCLPAGPLREPVQRLAEVDWLLFNGDGSGDSLNNKNNSSDTDRQHRSPARNTATIQLAPEYWYHLATQTTSPLKPLPWGDAPITAVAAIGHPQRFFNTLKDLGLSMTTTLAFDDHHQFVPANFADLKSQPVIMTTKDAVKCVSFAEDNWWALQVTVNLPEKLIQQVMELVKQPD